MKEISKLINKVLFLTFLIFSVEVESKIISEGRKDAKVVVKVFSSLTVNLEFHKKL